MKSAPGRFFYYVRPATGGGVWEVMLGLEGARSEHASEHEALEVARSAARRHWEDRHEPSAVYQIIPGIGRYIVDLFGV